MAIQKNFVIKNGIQVNNNLIFADKNSNKVGIATTNPQYTLDVRGGIGVTDISVIGIATISNMNINGYISIGNSLGGPYQLLASTGTGVTWTSVPAVRSVDVQNGSIGLSTFYTSYVVGLLDVYINGVKLTSEEYTADDSATVVLDTPCFGDETIEFITYSPFSIGFGATSIQGITVLDEGSVIGNPMQVTSINFVGTGVTSSGSGVGVTVYLSDYVDFSGISTYSSVSGISSYSELSGISTYSSVSGISSYSELSGISTYSSVSGISSYSELSGISTYSSVSGISSYSSVSGISSLTENFFGTPSIEVTTITATNGFTSGIGVTNPVQIQVSGNILTFNVVGVGSTSFTLF